MGRVQAPQQDLNRWHGNRSQAQPAGPLFEGSGQLRGQKGSTSRETKQVWTQAAGTLFRKLKRGPAAGKPSKAAGLLFEGSGPLRSQKGAPPGTRCKSKRGVLDLSLEYPAADPAPTKRNQETRPCMADFFRIDETRCRGSIQRLVHGALWGSAKRQTKREIKVRPLKERGREPNKTTFLPCPSLKSVGHKTVVLPKQRAFREAALGTAGMAQMWRLTF